MKLENRYIVLKKTDLNEYLPEPAVQALCSASLEVDAGRKAAGRGLLECLIIEKDWPEYEPALDMLSARVDGTVPHVWEKRELGKYEAGIRDALKPFIYDTPQTGAEPVVKHSHYKKDVRHLHTLDVYRVLQLFNVTDPAVQHAVKKLLVAGGRGAGKTREKDYREAVDSINRALQMLAEDDVDRVPLSN